MDNSVHRDSTGTQRRDRRWAEAERALQQSEELTRLAMQAGRMFAFDWNPSTDEVRRSSDSSDIIAFMGGATREAGKDSLQRIHPEDRERLSRTVKSLTPANDSYETEYRVIDPSGQIVTFRQTARAFFDESGQMVRLIGMTADITEHKRAEAALGESELRYKEVFDNTSECIFLLDVTSDGRFKYAGFNPAEEKMGYSSAGASGKFIEDVLPEELFKEVIGNYRRCLEAGALINYEEELNLPVGRRCFNTNLIPVRNADGRIHRIVGVARDITERKRAEAAQRESEERFRRVFEEGPLGLALVGTDFHFLKVNSAFCRMVGFSEEELTKMSFVEITYPDDVQPDVDLAAKLFKREVPFFKMQKRYVKKTGEIIWVNLTGSLISGGERIPMYAIAMIEDITEVKRAQEEALARQKLESLGVLTSGIAHDFNNLLGSILVDAELAEGELAAGSSAGEELQRIKTVAIRGAEIVRELMIYSGQDKADRFEPVDVSRLVEEMLALLKISISKHAVVKADLGKNLPTVRGNAPQIRQIVMNLVINASEAIGKEDGVISVTTSRIRIDRDSESNRATTLREGDYLRLEVSDTGRGMTEEVRNKIFDPFFSTKFAGRGLGLAVVQGIVRDHCGAINLVSAPDQGTTFQIFLPCDGEPAECDGADPIPASTERAPKSDATVLLVEDEDTLRLSVSKILRKKGFSVVEASEGRSAVNHLRGLKESIDVILLDMTIPGTSSLEVVQEARRIRPDAKIILTSAYSREIAMASLDGPQVRGYIRKPFRLADLVKLLRDTLASQSNAVFRG